MSQENVEIVRRANEAWNRDDLDAALLLIHPDIEVRQPGDLYLGMKSVYRGHAGVREWWNAAKEGLGVLQGSPRAHAGGGRQGRNDRAARGGRQEERRQG